VAGATGAPLPAAAAEEFAAAADTEAARCLIALAARAPSARMSSRSAGARSESAGTMLAALPEPAKRKG
jgi:hypothetical protein